MNVASRNGEATATTDTRKIAFFGPYGTFTEQALRTQPDLLDATHMPYRTVPDVLDAVSSGEVDLGFVPIENSIEGMVNFTVDALAFDHELLIVREVVLDIHLCVLARPGVTLDEITEVHSIPVATAQCHRFISDRLGDVSVVAAASTAAAAEQVAATAPFAAAIAPRVAAKRYGLDVVAENVEDHDGNQTRFVVVSRQGVPAPTGHDRTGLVVYQRADEPGSLMSILQQFAARQINISNLASRPIKTGGLGNYCFIIVAEGHIEDELLADAMKALHAKQGGVKFFGSWPRADAIPDQARVTADARRQAAQAWLSDLRGRVIARSSHLD